MNSADNLCSKAILLYDSVINEVISNLENSHIKIALIVDEDSKFLGTITDGDIRRGLLRGFGFNDPISLILNHNPIVVPPELGNESVKQIMVLNKIQQIPVINKLGKIVGIHLWDEISTHPKRTNLMIVMAGGLGTRLRPLTESCPKPMLQVSGKPILEHILDRAKLEGFSNFVFAIQYLGGMIKSHFGDGKNFGVQISYLSEESPLGTAGALSLLNPLPTSPFIVTNGDVISEIKYGDLLDFHCRNSANGTMAVRMHESRHPFGVVQTSGVNIIGFEEKPITRNLINAGVYALDPSSLSVLVKNQPCDMPTLFERLQEKSMRTVAYPIHESWLDIGRPDDYARANIV